MWKREEVPAQTPPPRFEAMPPPERSAPPAPPTSRATIGRAINIRGEVTGEEDLLIQGRIEGTVDLRQHSVTVGSEGHVKARITGRVVIIEGRVEGDLHAAEQVVLRRTAWVHGDISAPRVVLEDGARFRGGIDMGEEVEPLRPAAEAAPAQVRRTPEAAKAIREPVGKSAVEPAA